MAKEKINYACNKLFSNEISTSAKECDTTIKYNVFKSS